MTLNAICAIIVRSTSIKTGDTIIIMSSKNLTTAMSSVNLFFKNEEHARSLSLYKIIGHCELKDKKIVHNNLSFNLEGVKYEIVKAMLEQIASLLSDTIRSQAMIFDELGVRCLCVKNGKVTDLE